MSNLHHPTRNIVLYTYMENDRILFQPHSFWSFSPSETYPTFLELKDLANKNIGCLVKCEFQINNKIISQFKYVPTTTYLDSKTFVCCLPEIQIYLSIPHFIWQPDLKCQARDSALDLASPRVLKEKSELMNKAF